MTSQRFLLAGYAPAPAEAVVDIEALDTPRRLVRAAKGFVGWIAAAVVCVFIPIAHFVLVPLCTIGAFVFAARRFAQRAIVVRAHGRCPDCGAEQELDLLGPWTGRKDLVCRSCQRPMTLKAA